MCKHRQFLFILVFAALSNVDNHRHICWFQEHNGQSKVFKLEAAHRSKVIVQCWKLCAYESSHYNTRSVDIMVDPLCIYSLCYNRALWDHDELRCQLFSDNKGSAGRILPCQTMHAAAYACFSVKNTVNSGLWMLMLGLNHFIGSVHVSAAAVLGPPQMLSLVETPIPSQYYWSKTTD